MLYCSPQTKCSVNLKTRVHNIDAKPFIVLRLVFNRCALTNFRHQTFYSISLGDLRLLIINREANADCNPCLTVGSTKSSVLTVLLARVHTLLLLVEPQL